MPTLYEIVKQLTELTLSDPDHRRLVRDFAHLFGWTPSDNFVAATAGADKDFANGHLVVEHGLENTAVISFLKRPFSSLGYEERRKLLNISYNNLVDWHIQVELERVTYVFNRAEMGRVVAQYSLSRTDLSRLSSQAFEEVSGKRQNPNLPALDDALIATIRTWKNFLATEIGNLESNTELSALFNAIIFTRAVEDNFRRVHFIRTGEWLESRALLEAGLSTQQTPLTLRQIIRYALEKFGQPQIPSHLIDESLLSVFDDLTADTVATLLGNFYRIRGASPYEYDFSVMSKHALSRIYERYVTLLRVKESKSGQTTFYFVPPEEESNKLYGGVYTPEYIARFFARYLREQMPPIAFKRLHTLEPAVGSGIFLRTLLEMQCDPLQEGMTTERIETAFTNVIGIDVDPNATQAARLSLSLLHLVLTGFLPQELQMHSAEAIQFFEQHDNLKESRDVVLSNPPFIPVENQSDALRERLVEFMAEDAGGRIDTYLAFLKLAIQSLKPGGYGMFVLPQAFLLNDYASKMRKFVTESCWVRCLVDLSTIRVFEDTSVYVILLIFQKRPPVIYDVPEATIVKCQEFVSKALQAAVEDRVTENDYYQIYHVPQETFTEKTWITLPPALADLEKKLASMPKLEDFLYIRQGFVTGADKIFIVPKEVRDQLDLELFVPYLSDREMQPYKIPESTAKFVFYPYIGDEKLGEERLKKDFYRTWEYLNSHHEFLSKRTSLKDGNLPWWYPIRSRLPEHLMRPKIVSPHVVLAPRFSLDLEGKYAISHSPLFYPKEKELEHDLLRYFLAVLNSTVCFHDITQRTHKYSRGYSVLEVTTLKKVPVPDPRSVPATRMREVLSLVDERINAKPSQFIDIEKRVDEIILDLYGLTQSEKATLGLG